MDTITQLIEQLQSPDPATRQRTARALGVLADPRAIDALVAYLQDPTRSDPPEKTNYYLSYQNFDPYYERYGYYEPGPILVREAVVKALGEIGTSAVVAPLLDALQDNEPKVQRAAADALIKLDDINVVEPLLALLPGEAANYAAEVLGKLGDIKAVKPLIALALSEDRNKQTRIEALGALGQLQNRQAVDAVRACCQDADSSIQQRAAQVLCQLGDAQFLEKMILKNQARDHLIPTLGRYGKLGFQLLIPLLETATQEERSQIARAMGEIADTRAIPLLLPLLEDESQAVRKETVEALGKLRAAQAVKEVIPLLQDRDPIVRRLATSTLGSIGNRQAVEPLIQALQQEDQFVQRNAIEALGLLGDLQAVEPLLLIMHKSDPSRRTSWRHQYVAEALGRLGDARAVEPLIQAFQKCKPHSWTADKQLSRKIIEALGLLRDARAVEPLIQALRMDLSLKQSAVEALGRLGDARAVEPLIQAFQQEDGPGIPLIHPNVVKALGKLGGTQAIEGLRARLRQMDQLFADCDRPDRYDDLENEYLLIMQTLAQLETSEK